MDELSELVARLRELRARHTRIGGLGKTLRASGHNEAAVAAFLTAGRIYDDFEAVKAQIAKARE